MSKPAGFWDRLFGRTAAYEVGYWAGVLAERQRAAREPRPTRSAYQINRQFQETQERFGLHAPVGSPELAAWNREENKRVRKLVESLDKNKL